MTISFAYSRCSFLRKNSGTKTPSGETTTADKGEGPEHHKVGSDAEPDPLDWRFCGTSPPAPNSSRLDNVSSDDRDTAAHYHQHWARQAVVKPQQKKDVAAAAGSTNHPPVLEDRGGEPCRVSHRDALRVASLRIAHGAAAAGVRPASDGILRVGGPRYGVSCGEAGSRQQSMTLPRRTVDGAVTAAVRGSSSVLRMSRPGSRNSARNSDGEIPTAFVTAGMIWPQQQQQPLSSNGAAGPSEVGLRHHSLVSGRSNSILRSLFDSTAGGLRFLGEVFCPAFIAHQRLLSSMFESH